jgi:hypothetical protein
VYQLITFICLLLTAAPLWADIVVLHNGDRLHGQIVSESNSAISLRRLSSSGKSHFTQRIQQSEIARIIRTDTQPTSRPATITPERATATRPADAGMTWPEKQELLTEAINSWKHKNLRATDIRLTGLMYFTTAAERTRLSAVVEDQLETTLADLAAEARLQAAIARAKDRPIDLEHVDNYVIPPLIVRLELTYADAMQQPVITKRKSRATTQPAGDPRFTVARWLDKPREFQGTRRQAEALARQARLARSLLSERLRLAPAATTPPSVRSEWQRDLNRLDTFLTALTPHKTRSKLTIDNEPARLPADDSLEEQRRQWLEQRRQAELEQITEEEEIQQMELLPE